MIYNKTTGYFECGELKDISLEEAMMCLDTKFCSPNALSNIRARIIFFTPQYRITMMGLDTFNVFRSTRAEYIYLFDNVLFDEGSQSTLYYMGYESFRLKKVVNYGTLQIQCKTSIPFYNCGVLTYLKISSLKFDINLSTNKNLSLESIVYMIDRCYNKTSNVRTRDFTMHLHEQAYNRAFDDETAYTWNGQTYYGIIELAEAVGVSIVYP